MEAHQIEITLAAFNHGRISLRPCGKTFFPAKSFGKPSESEGTGRKVRLHVYGLNNTIETDLPTDRTGNPRWFFRKRAWVKPFVQSHRLKPGDKINITRLSDDEYRIEPVNRQIKFIDLFAGIGGFRLALERVGGECVFTCEWNKYAQKTYNAWFGEKPHGDIREIKPAEIPDHDILVAGFPCQPFSIAGVSKKKSLGRPTGFKDVTQGTLFFHLATIIEIKRPPVLLLENVKNLLSHDGGKTWDVIQATLNDLKYWVFHKVIDAAAYVPQHRERVFIVCFNKLTFPQKPAFEFPEPPQGPAPKLRDILEQNPPDKYTLSDHLWSYLQEYAQRHREKGNGFGFGLADLEGVSRTISARYYKDGSEILIPQSNRNPRRLTPHEAARLMGFPDDKKIVVSDTQAYKQFGNAVVPRVAEAVARKIIPVLAAQFKRNGNGCLLKGRVHQNNNTGTPTCSRQLVNV